MSADVLAFVFIAGTLPILPPYLLMVFLPHTGFTQRVMRSLWSVIVPSILLIVFGVAFVLTEKTILPRFIDLLASSLNRSAFASLQQIASDFPPALLVLWLHAIAADLVMARWAYLESRELKLNTLLSSIAVLFMSTNGPLGFLIYFAVREITLRQRKRTQAA